MDETKPTQSAPVVEAPSAEQPPSTPDDGLSSAKSRFVAAWEVAGGDTTKVRSRYNPLPHWPEGESGLTVGFGYDLKYNLGTTVQKDWAGKLTPAELDRLDDYAPTIGKKGKWVPPKKTGNTAAVKATKDIEVRYEDAVKVLEETTIPKFEATAEKTFPGYSELDPYSQGVILSLVYNRGGAMGKKRSLRYKHFMMVKEAVAKKDAMAIAAAIRKMKIEHNKPENKKGLHRRRDGEAQYIEQHQKEIRQFYDAQAARKAAATPAP
jgi:GH24 family phage-related lysozyme (muramidase)